MTENRFRRGKGIFIDYPSEAIIDGKTNERYYDGIKPNYESSKEIVDLLNELYEENKQLKQSNKLLRINKKDCEKGRINERKSFEKFDKSRVEHIRFLQKRLKDNGLSIYKNE